MALIRDYLRLTELHKTQYGDNTIIFMQNGAFFEIYALRDELNNYSGSDICEFSKICDLNIVDKKMQGNLNIIVNDLFAVNAGFKTHLVDKYIKKMQDVGYTILIYEEEETTTNSNDKKNRILVDTYSPGTYISFDNATELNNNICCIWIEIKKRRSKIVNQIDVYVGISLIDVYTGKTYMSEFEKEWIKNPTTFDELECFISSFNPSETIIISNLNTCDVYDIISFCNIKSKSLHLVDLNANSSPPLVRAKQVEKQTYQYEILNKFYNIIDPASFIDPFKNNVYSTQSFCYLLDFTYQHNPNLINKISEPIFENTNDKLILANHSLKQLNIIDDNNYTGKYSSVIKMLNVCITSLGKREFNHNFLNPTMNEDHLNAEYEIIDYLLQNKLRYDIIKSFLSSIYDLSKINRQILLKKTTPKLIYHLYAGIITAQQMYQNILENDEILYTYLSNKIPNLDEIALNFTHILDYINLNLIIDECKYIDNLQKIESNFICTGINQQLDQEMETLIENQDKLECCRKYYNTILHNNEIANSSSKRKNKKKIIKCEDNDNEDEEDDNDTEGHKNYIKIHVTEKNNIGLIATSKRCDTLLNILKSQKKLVGEEINLTYNSNFFNCEKTFALNLSNLEIHKQSSTNKYITNPQIQNICESIFQIKTKITNTMIKVFNQIIDEMEIHSSRIDQICDFIKYVDLAYAKMSIANKFNYCRPVITTDVDKSFINTTGLRHCLIEKIQQDELYVSNDLCIGDGNMDGMLLYGTNAVGKTSFIRALGIATIMAQSGLYVPASSFEFKPYKYIFTRILGNDNIFKGLSTFAVEMSELRTILKLANKNSLVLGDELCSGTESTSATSIFVSGIRHLNEKNCTFIFATHLHEILEYDEINELEKVHIKHMSVIYNKETKTLEYDRKLKDGAGNNMYGLEVCKSLHLPDTFLEYANNIRMKYHPESDSILNRKQSHFNSKKIRGICEICNENMGSEVHHLQYQSQANEDGIIRNNESTFHKNHMANLVNICEQCHDKIHKKNKQYKKVKTTGGIILKEI